ncbi:hypothetical protein MKW92_041286 [Papaver armeniacum]|nr:hypothetical protein MKW92_041286 [Papaver armeniacum]
MTLLVHETIENGMIATFFCIIELLVTRWIYSEHFPLSDLYESLMFLSMHQSTIIIPALQSQWLMMHVSMVILSYAALLCGSLSISLLIQYVNERSNAILNNSLVSFGNYHMYQLIQQSNCWRYRVISLGFIFLTVGILSGAVWANEAWGHIGIGTQRNLGIYYLDYKVHFAIYLHNRKELNFQGTNSTIVASMGFLIIWVCYFGVNLLGIGLHSYDSFTLAS